MRKVCVSDPPYGATDLHWDIPPLDMILGISRQVDALVLTCNHAFLGDLMRLGMPQKFHDLIVWNKTPHRTWVSWGKPLRSMELISFWGQGSDFDFRQSLSPNAPYALNRRGATQHGGKAIAKKEQTVSYPMWEQVWGDIIPVPKKEKIHPTQKPLELLRRMVQISTQGKAPTVVIDPFCGTDTTGRACQELGVKYQGSDSGGWLIPSGV